MTISTFQSIINELERAGPARSVSEKRARLVPMRARLVHLHHAGHSWAAIARALTASGEKITVQMLRTICRPKSRRTTRTRAKSAPMQAVPQSLGGMQHE